MDRTIITFPRGLEFDAMNPPEDFEEQIQKSFAEYTNGTRKEYMYQDKLLYIDQLRKRVHGNQDSDDAVYDMIKKSFGDRLDEFGEIASESDFLSIDFMIECYEAGDKPLYFRGRRHDEQIMELIARAIKAVMDYEGEE